MGRFFVVKLFGLAAPNTRAGCKGFAARLLAAIGSSFADFRRMATPPTSFPNFPWDSHTQVPQKPREWKGSDACVGAIEASLDKERRQAAIFSRCAPNGIAKASAPLRMLNTLSGGDTRDDCVINIPDKVGTRGGRR